MYIHTITQQYTALYCVSSTHHDITTLLEKNNRKAEVMTTTSSFPQRVKGHTWRLASRPRGVHARGSGIGPLSPAHAHHEVKYGWLAHSACDRETRSLERERGQLASSRASSMSALTRAHNARGGGRACNFLQFGLFGPGRITRQYY